MYIHYSTVHVKCPKWQFTMTRLRIVVKNTKKWRAIMPLCVARCRLPSHISLSQPSHAFSTFPRLQFLFVAFFMKTASYNTFSLVGLYSVCLSRYCSESSGYNTVQSATPYRYITSIKIVLNEQIEQLLACNNELWDTVQYTKMDLCIQRHSFRDGVCDNHVACNS